MQLDSEPEQNQSCPGDEPPCEDTGYNDSHLEKEMLNDDSEINKGGSEESCGCKSSQQIADPPLLGDKPGPFAYTYVDDSTNGNRNDGGHKTAPHSFSLPCFGKVGKEAELYTDKAVTEVELPKMILCYKEGSYHIIKNIRIDEGTDSFNKVLVENGAECEKCCNSSQVDRDEYTNELHISDALKSSTLIGQPISDALDGNVCNEADDRRIKEGMYPPQNSCMHQFQGCKIDDRNEKLKQRSLASLLAEDRVKSDISGEIVHASETEGSCTVRKFDIGQYHFALSSSGSNLDQPHLINNGTDQPQSINGDCEQPQCAEAHHSQHVRCDCTKLPSVVGNSDQLLSDHDDNNEKQARKCELEVPKSTTSDANSEDPREGNSAMNLSVSGKSGRRINAFDIDSDLPTTDPEKDIGGVSESQRSGFAACGVALEDASADGPGALTQASLNYPGRSDSSFLGPPSLSARIAYVGPIPYSGSISMRSESSATSTRSFAFPILQSEWNSSPVRMARTDRTHLKKHWFWRSRLLCCRF